MKHLAMVLVAAALLAAIPSQIEAQRAAKHFRHSSRAHLDRRHAPLSYTSQFALVSPGPALGAPLMHAASGGPPRLRAAGTLPVRLSWSATDVTLASAFTAALLIDAGQTRGLAQNGWAGWRETNPILGPRPSVGQLDTYTAVAGLAVLGTAAALPARFRSWFLGAAFAVEAFTIAGTVQRGVAIRLP